MNPQPASPGGVVPIRPPKDVTEELRQLGIPPLTDAGNAERFASNSGGFLRYVHGWDKWIKWDDTRWSADASRDVYRLAIEAIRLISADVPGLSPVAGFEATKHALKSEKRERIEAMVALARSLPPIPVQPTQLDCDPDLLNVQNGILDLRTGRLASHNSLRLLTKLASAAFDPLVKAPTWVAFLERVLPDPEVRSYLQRAVGYSLTGNVGEHCLFFCYGTGANGKSTFLETLRELLTESEYAKSAGPDLLLSKKQDRHEEEIAELRGARFVTTVEAGSNRFWDESRVKWLTGGDMLSARFLHKDRFSFAPSHKLWVAANHRPRVRGTDHGFWRRVHLIPFTVTVPEAERDPDLRMKLRAELSGILNWGLEGALEWRRIGLKPPEAVRAATDEYRSGEDVIAAFLEECCTITPTGFETVANVYGAFQEWSEKSGERSCSSRELTEALIERPGITRKRGTGGERRLNGMILKAKRGTE